MAEWKDFGDGIYQCSHCGMPAGWSHPRIASQILSDYCGSCGEEMENASRDNRTPRERKEAKWLRNGKHHQYYCSICGQKESAPRKWCPNCGTRMSKDSWKKPWGVGQLTQCD